MEMECLRSEAQAFFFVGCGGDAWGFMRGFLGFMRGFLILCSFFWDL